jgi:hypothetical protein
MIMDPWGGGKGSRAVLSRCLSTGKAANPLGLLLHSVLPKVPASTPRPVFISGWLFMTKRRFLKIQSLSLYKARWVPLFYFS